MSDLTYSWKFYAYNLMLDYGEGEGSSFSGDLKGSADDIVISTNIRANAESPMGTPVTLTYKFVTGAPTDSNIRDFDFLQDYTAVTEFLDTPVSDARKARALETFEEVSSFTNITFKEAAEGETANINIFQQERAGGIASALRGSSDATFIIMGDAYRSSELLTTYDQSDDVLLDKWHYKFRHELGHALGLSHPTHYGEDNWPDVSHDHSSNDIMPEEATDQYTVMSYVGHAQFQDKYRNPVFEATYGTEGQYSVKSFGLFDIATLQMLYGANTAPTAGDNTYSFAATKSSVLTIYDSGGTDTLDLSNQVFGTKINLMPSSFSSIGLVDTSDGSKVLFQNNVSITPDTIIENVIGSRHSDVLMGNNAANKLEGGKGDDQIRGAEGNDIIVAGEGADKVNGGTGNDRIWSGTGDTSNDTLEGGNGSDTIGGGAGDDLIYGDRIRFFAEGDDILYGNMGDDTLDGGIGDDTLWGGDGDDLLIPKWGFDDMIGGSGSDIFVISVTSGPKTIRDFDVTEDKLDLTAFDISTLEGIAAETTQNGQSGVLLSLDEHTEVFLATLTLENVSDDIATF